ncbi:MAG: ACT domain-containing protein [Clostridiales Family XIII bacterium]|jgi:hypothetical protein|nr:ACT domain-containing protein [Clostridiales Family XIII bacterium]
MTVDQLSIFVENGPGKLADVTKILGDAGADLRAMSIADTRDFGILRIIVDDAYGALSTLKEADYIVSVTKVIAVEIRDKPGGLASVLAVLASAGISVEYLYAFVSQKAGNAYVILRVEDNDKAVAALGDNGVNTVGAEDLFEKK